MVSLFTSFRLLRLKQYDFNHTTDIDCLKTNNKYCCIQYEYSDAKKQYLLSQSSKCENQSRLQKDIQHIDKLFSCYKCLYMSWNLNQPLILFFSNGALVSLEFNFENNTLLKIEIDETLCGKFLSSRLVDIIICENVLYASYVEPKLSIIQVNRESRNLMAKMLGKKKGKIVGFDPKVFNCDLCVSSPKPADRKLSLNKDKNLLIIWWRNSGDDVWPWMPITYLTDRLNLFIYSVSGTAFEVLYSIRVQNELLYAVFSKECPYKFFCLEESKKDESTLTNICTYEIKEGHCQMVHSAQLPSNEHLVAFNWSATEDKLIASDSSGLLFIYDVNLKYYTIHPHKLKYLPIHIVWHPQTCIALIVCKNNQILCVDIALNLLNFKLCYKSNSQCDIDISSFFSPKITIQKVLWQKSILNDTCLLFLDPKMSSFLLLKISFGHLSRYNVSYLELISQYLKCNEFDKAKLIYSKLDWEFNSDYKFQCLSKIVNYLFKKPFNSINECNLEFMLGSFYRWIDDIPRKVVENLEPKMYHMTRRFFHRLLNSNRLEKAWSLAVDLDSQDLFLDLYQVARKNNENILAATALHKAEQYDSHLSDSCSGSCQSDTCSESSTDVEACNPKWTSFRKMFQTLLDDQCGGVEDGDEQVTEPFKVLDLHLNQSFDKKQSEQHENTFSETVPTSFEPMYSFSSKYVSRSSSKLSLMEIPPDNFETSNFRGHSKYATTPFSSKDCANRWQKKIAYANKIEKTIEQINDFPLRIEKDRYQKSCSVDIADNASERLYNTGNGNFCFSEKWEDLNNLLIENPPFTSGHKENLPLPVSKRNTTSFKNPVCDSSEHALSLTASSYAADYLSGTSFSPSFSNHSSNYDFNKEISVSKLLDNSNHEKKFKSKNCIDAQFDNERIIKLIDSTSFPCLNKSLPKKSTTASHLFGDRSSHLPLVHQSFYTDYHRHDASPNEHLLTDSKDFISPKLHVIGNEFYSSDFLNKSHKLLKSPACGKNVKQSQFGTQNSSVKYFSSPTESPVHGILHSIHQDRDQQHFPKAYGSENYATEEESEEMEGTKIKLDHLGVI